MGWMKCEETSSNCLCFELNNVAPDNYATQRKQSVRHIKLNCWMEVEMNEMERSGARKMWWPFEVEVVSDNEI